jgi:hypothetical protein
VPLPASGEAVLPLAPLVSPEPPPELPLRPVEAVLPDATSPLPPVEPDDTPLPPLDPLPLPLPDAPPPNPDSAAPEELVAGDVPQ